jgi:glycyl-tRNA synthetase beta chain
MSELLLEILSEEIPAGMVLEGVSNLDSLLQKELENLANASVGSVKHYSTPRRIALSYRDIIINSSIEEIKGPKITAPDQAISGFLSKYNISSTDDLEVRDGVYYYQSKKRLLPLNEAVKKAVENAIEKLVWPKSMRWGTYSVKWGRPMHSIICLLDGQTIDVKFGPITADNKTKGHRYLSSGDVIVSNCDDYAQKLRDANIEPDYHIRKQSILDQISKILPQHCSLKKDDALLDEVTNLVEKPFVMLGSIGPELMSLPPEILIISLKENQRYLLLENEKGELAPYFIIVSNISGSENGKEIIEGNQKVLQARLYDAIFFYEQDKKTPLSSLVDKLKGITYEVQIGSVYNKIQSTINMAKKLAPLFNINIKIAEDIIPLCKADLVTNVVREFPELQGVMGYYYALNEGMSKDSALAIKEHYKPQGPSESVPSTNLGRLIALSDKLDAIKQLFDIGIKPTSSKDPFALRRAAIGCLRIIQTQGLNTDILHNLDLGEEVVTFIFERLRHLNN